METSQPFGSTLPHPITATLHDDNPWWRGERLFGLPSLRRWAFDAVLSGVQRGLTPATVLRGPRQVGKTTLLNQVIDVLLAGFGDEQPLDRFQQERARSLLLFYVGHVGQVSDHSLEIVGESRYR